jgi:trk system potassium uptake protein TrkH
MLMLFGGCVASTAGGLKVYRITVLASALRHWLRSAVATPLEVISPRIGRHTLRPTDVEQALAITVGWCAAIAAGWMTVTLIGQLGEWASLSAVVSALSNIGPHFIPAAEHAALSPWVKGILALAMIAGRLEILPVIILFWRKTWR